MKIHRCKFHHYTHLYTRCPACGCEYCAQVWPVCPRTSWHPQHATTDEERGRRYRELEEGRQRRQVRS
jgi:hypothetical protein